MPPRKATTARKAAAKKAAPKKAAPKRNTTRKTAPKKTVAKKSSRATMPDVPTAALVKSLAPRRSLSDAGAWCAVRQEMEELRVGRYGVARRTRSIQGTPFSYQQWVEDDINDSTGERPVAAPKIPRPEQVSGLQPSSMPLAPANADFCWQTMQAWVRR